MAIEVIPLSRLQNEVSGVLTKCCDSREAVVVELPDHRMVSIQPLDADDEADSLVNELLESNEQFRALVRKSIESARTSFAAEGDDAVQKPNVPGANAMTNTSASTWEGKRTEETRVVENVLRAAGFSRADAYRYNSASIRVRVIDPRFEGLAVEDRDALVEPHLDQLPDCTQADITNLFSFAPSEIEQPPGSARAQLMNLEFEEPSPSRL
jgi:hypothetical protein